jgi:hypothetical protein
MRTGFVAALFVWSLVARSAMGETPPESAGALFVSARSLMKAGDCVNALPLLEQSHALEPALGTRLNIAICEVKVGKLVEAAAKLQSVIDASTPTDARRAHAERALTELLPRIPQLVLALDDTRRSLEHVRLDGEPAPDLRVNEPFRINPGTHELEVVLAREPKQVRRFTVEERQVFTWSLGGSSAAAVGPTTVQSRTNERPRDAEARSQPQSAPTVFTKQRKIAAVAAGTSLVALGVGTGFAFSARAIYDSSDCTTDDVCQPGGMEQRERARDQGNIATIAFTVGIASAVGAATLWFTGAPRDPAGPKPMRVGVRWNAARAAEGTLVVEGGY